MNLTPELMAEVCKRIGQRVRANERAKGFCDDREALQKLANENGLGAYTRALLESQAAVLEISEIVESVEALRKASVLPGPEAGRFILERDKHCPEFMNIEVELADAVLRIMCHAAERDYRLGEAILAKMEFNETRPKMHNGKLF